MGEDGHLVLMNFDDLSPNDVEVQVFSESEGLVPLNTQDRNLAEIVVEQKTDEKGNYSLLKLIRTPETPRWTATRVKIPKVVLPNGAEWADLEVWSSGAPLRIVADASDRETACFEVVFCHPDISWTGWKNYRVSLRSGTDNLGNDRLQAHEIQNPLQVKYILIIMRIGQPWEIGLRSMTIRLDPER